MPDPMNSTPEAAPAGDAPAAAPPADLESRLKAAEAEVARLNDDYLRARADAENVRRRAVEDVAKAHKFGIESFAASLLAVRDSLEAALAVPAPTVESLRQGVEITARQLAGAFEKAALKEIAPQQGEKFDPHRHQALSQVPSDQPDNTVVTVVQKGYLLHDRVVRPALVMVARAPAEPAPSPEPPSPPAA